MKSVIINPKNKKEFEFLNNLLHRLGYDFSILSDDEKEDLALLNAMVKEKKGDYVSEEQVLQILRKK